MEVLQQDNEVTTVAKTLPQVIDEIEVVSTSKPFIEANTVESSLAELKNKHIIPVFIKDNEPVISHAEFISTTTEAVAQVFHGEGILKPSVRLSHPIKGRIPEAKNKPANALLEHEKTIYFERMAFVVEVPTICSRIADNVLNLTIGGVKSYNLDNLYNKSGADQHFKVFIGFQNKVCTNLCVSTDGYLGNLKVKSLDQLYKAIVALIQDFNAVQQAERLQAFQQYEITDRQFANIIGRCRMYKYLPDSMKENIPELLLGDSQINTVCKDYYMDNNFCCTNEGSINLWNLYNLFTGSNKSSYIDTFLDRSVNAFTLTKDLQIALQNNSGCWFLN